MTVIINGTQGTTTPGLYSNAAFTGTYVDGIVADYSTGLGRISVGSADGLAFYNGGVATTELMRLDSSGNLGLGVTPSAWSSSFKVLQISGGASWANAGSYYMTANAYYDGAYKYYGVGYATRYAQNGGGAGGHAWSVSASGAAAGDPITFTQAMTLTSGGVLQVGTTQTTAASNFAMFGAMNGNTAGTVRIGSSDQNNAALALTNWTGASTNNGCRISFDNSGRGGFEIGASSASNNFDICRTWGTPDVRIDSSGNLLVGTTSSNGGLTGAYPRFVVVPPNGSSHGMVLKSEGSAYDAGLIWNSGTSGNNHFFEFGTETSYTARGSISYNRAGGLVAYNTTSDYRAKTVNGPVQNALAKLVALKPCTGRMNGAEIDIDFFVAHELQEIVPSAVNGEKDAAKEDGTPIFQMVDKSALIPLLTAAIQEQQAIIESLKARLDAANL